MFLPVGAINISFDVPHLGELELTHPDIQNGGHWTPRDCLSRHRTAIIIPFRDREEHLQILINYLHPFLQRQLLYYTIFVIEQVRKRMSYDVVMFPRVYSWLVMLLTTLEIN